MSDTTSPMSLLDELDSRQNDVLAKIDELNERLESVLNHWLSNREAEAA